MQAKLNFAAHGSSLDCSSLWETHEKSDLLFLLRGWDSREAATAADAGTMPSPAHTYVLSCPTEPSLALQGSGTAEDTAEQQLLGLPLPEHPSALPTAALLSHLSLAKL